MGRVQSRRSVEISSIGGERGNPHTFFSTCNPSLIKIMSIWYSLSSVDCKNVPLSFTEEVEDFLRLLSSSLLTSSSLVGREMEFLEKFKSLFVNNNKTYLTSKTFRNSVSDNSRNSLSDIFKTAIWIVHFTRYGRYLFRLVTCINIIHI